MPRLRRLKIYEPISIEYEREETGQEWSNDSSDNDGSNEPERGWWSTPNIILSLPDNKIKTAISYHKEQLSILQKELDYRKLNHRECFNSNRKIGDQTSKKYPNLSPPGQGLSGLSDADRKVKRTLQKQRFLSAGQKSLIFQIYLDAKKQNNE